VHQLSLPLRKKKKRKKSTNIIVVYQNKQTKKATQCSFVTALRSLSTALTGSTTGTFLLL
jgi:transcriptional regulator GlxA family with amidase domain